MVHTLLSCTTLERSDRTCCSCTLTRVSRRFLRAVTISAALSASLSVGRPSAESFQRTPDGHPDLQGMWLNNTATPLERSKAVNGRAAFTEAEVQEHERRYLLDRTIANSRFKSFALDAAGADLDTYEPGPLLPGRRTSMINDPPHAVPARWPNLKSACGFPQWRTSPPNWSAASMRKPCVSTSRSGT